MSELQTVPVCRQGATAEDIQRLADRSVLYGACLKALRPDTRLKPQIREAALALLPGVHALYEGQDDDAARFAHDYAMASGGIAFLERKIQEYQARKSKKEGL